MSCAFILPPSEVMTMDHAKIEELFQQQMMRLTKQSIAGFNKQFAGVRR